MFRSPLRVSGRQIFAPPKRDHPPAIHIIFLHCPRKCDCIRYKRDPANLLMVYEPDEKQEGSEEMSIEAHHLDVIFGSLNGLVPQRMLFSAPQDWLNTNLRVWECPRVCPRASVTIRGTALLNATWSVPISMMASEEILPPIVSGRIHNYSLTIQTIIRYELVISWWKIANEATKEPIPIILLHIRFFKRTRMNCLPEMIEAWFRKWQICVGANLYQPAIISAPFYWDISWPRSRCADKWMNPSLFRRARIR